MRKNTLVMIGLATVLASATQASLNDIQKVLSTDLTAKGVKGLRSTVRDANWHYTDVNRTINSALEEMKKMETALAPDAK